MSTKYSAVAMLAAVFFAGIASTLAVLRVVENRHVPSWVDGDRRPPLNRAPFARGPGGPGGLAELARMELSDRLAQRLGLSDEQRAALDTIMERRRQQAQALMGEFMPRLQGQTDSLQAEIEAVLTPEQREVFREFARGDRERFRRRRPGRSGEGGGRSPS
ncbi:MAG: hypothetical protein HKN73_10750 [Gemmatimonadetes bacterium]|nr:hypothetical protein [Gemmatimonadota bacterium]